MNKTQLHKNICNYLTETYESKNKDYGDSFSKQFQEYGLISSAIRLEAKLSRFMRF